MNVVRSSQHDNDLSQRSFERILIIKPSSLGDIVHALPVLHGLRVRYPRARIDWLVSTPFAPLIEHHPELNDVIRFDRGGFGKMVGRPRLAAKFVRFVRDLRLRAYDLVIDLQGLFRSGFLTRASGAAVRLGFGDAREGASLFYNHRLDENGAQRHAVDRNYLVARRLGFEDVPIVFDLAISESTEAMADNLLRQAGLSEGQPFVAIVPGARWETKAWRPDRFAATIDAMDVSDGVRCVLLGAPMETALCEGIAASCRSEPINLAGRTSLPVLAAALSRSAVVLCHDSAAMHLAVAMDRPLVCLTGPTNPHRTGPYRRMEDVLRVDLDCSPCYLRDLSRCRHDHRCMEEIEVATVVQAIERAGAGTQHAAGKK